MSMFRYFKDKIKDSLSSFSKKTEEEGETIEETEEAPAQAEAAAPEQQEEAPSEPEESPSSQEAPAEDSSSSAKAPEAHEEAASSEGATEEEPSSQTAEASTQDEGPEGESEEDDSQKTGFFGKLKGAFSKTEESEEPAESTEAETTASGEASASADESTEATASQAGQSEVSPATESTTEPAAEDTSEDQETAQETGDKKGFFGKIKQSVTSKRLSQQKFEELFWDLEVAMLENNVAMEVIEKIKQDLSQQIVDAPIPRNKIEQTIMRTLSSSISELFEHEPFDLSRKMDEKKPYVICFVGVNGSGKTTTIAKMAHMLKAQGKDVVLAAADTFRAAAIDQLSYHADQVGVKIIKHDYGNDAAAVAHDAINHARSKGKDAVLIDTAGRMHSNRNLLDELKKVVRVSEPDLKLFVGESITGNDCIEQAKEFNEAVGIDGIILSKADIDEKGGAAISVSYVTGKPILYMGTGQEYSDIEPFDKQRVLETLSLEE